MRTTYLQSLGIGTIAGMRSMSAPAFVAQRVGTSYKNIFFGLALAEFIADKLPVIPDRTQPMSLIGRMGMGALSAAVYSRDKTEKQESVVVPILLGSVGAAVSTFAVFYLRKWLGKRLGVKDFFLGLIEDSAVMGIEKVQFLNLDSFDKRRA